MLYLGLMSGTSLDGVDLALCRFSDVLGQGSYVVLHAATIPYPPAWEERLRGAMSLSGYELTKLDRDLGRFLGEAVAAFLKDIGHEGIILASHGHTVFHAPQEGFTLQIGHGPTLRRVSGLPTVYDFRSADVAAGGQGAPLVPVAERDLLGSYAACLNLGGFANISFLQEPIRAFDIAPCNTVLNDLAQRTGKPYDDGGSMARSGAMVPELLQKLDALAYYSQKGPKSLGREFVQTAVVPLLADYTDASVADLARTFTEHVAGQITRCVTELKDRPEVLVTGGGAYNKYLLERMGALAPGVRFVVPDAVTVNYKEAIAFAYLGYLHMKARPGNIPSVTGARMAVELGSFCP